MPTLVPQPHGGALLSGGAPGNAGGTGRPPHAFVARMRELAGSDQRCEQLEAVLSDPAHPHWLAALRFVSAYGYGKPHATLEVDAVVSAATSPKAVWRFGDQVVEF